MNPALMWVQAGCLAVACAVLGLAPGGHVWALALALVLAAHWTLMSATYAHALQGRRRSTGEDEGPDREGMDRRVRRQVVVVVVVGLVAGIAGGWLGVRLWHDRTLLTICFGALAALAWVIYLSSLIDWYYVRPRIDGVVCEPPCRSSGDPRWGNLTRLWYLHRGVADFFSLVAVIVAFSSLVGALIAGDGTLPTAAAVALPTGAATALLLLTQGAIATLRHRAATGPSIWVGDELRDDGWRAYVLQVNVRGIVVRERFGRRRTWGRPAELTHNRLEGERLECVRVSRCERCRLLNPACEWAATDHDANLPQRRLIW